MILTYIKKYWYIIIIIFLLISNFILLNDNFRPEKSFKSEVIKIPKIENSIDKPIGIIHHKGKKDSIIYKPGKVIYTENPINKKMAEELIEAIKDQDTLKVLKLYLKSIGEKEETHIFKDKVQTIEVFTKVRGELLEQKILKYSINEQELKVNLPIKEQQFAVYVGSSLQYTNELKLVPSAQVGVQISKRLIITGQYGLDKSYQCGVLYKIKL